MRRLVAIILLAGLVGPAAGQSGNPQYPLQRPLMNQAGQAVPYGLSDIPAPDIAPAFTGASADKKSQVVTASPNSGSFGQYPSNSIAITAAATGTTSAVTATLTGLPGRTTWICGIDVSAIGGTATIGPVTISNLIGNITFTYQIASTAAGNTLSRTFQPCIPAKATNTSIAVATTADGTATAVDVNAWGFQQ